MPGRQEGEEIVPGVPTSPEPTGSSTTVPSPTNTPKGTGGRLLSGVDAAEAGRLSGIARRAARDATHEDAVVTALRRRAQQGDAAAARELRNWLDRQEETKPARPLSELTPEERQQVAAEILARRGIQDGPRPGLPRPVEP